MKKNKFKYGKVNLLPDLIEDKDVTVHISLKIEGDLLRDIRALAEKDYMPYQTKLKQMLRRQLEIERPERKLESVPRKPLHRRRTVAKKAV